MRGNHRKSPPRVAVVGAGYWGKNLVRNFHDLGALSVICDTDPKLLTAIGKQYPSVRTTDSLEQVLADPDIAAVSIATPAETHAGLVKEALLRGKDVLVEKPLALSLSDGEELVAFARETGRILMVGHLLWYHPAILKLKELVDGGELGRIQYIYSNRLNLGRIRREENILWSFAPHDISVILGLLNEMPDAVQSHGGNYLHQQIADVTVTALSFPSGVRAHIFVSWLHPFKEQKLVVVGDRQMAVFDDVEETEKLVLYPHSVAWKNHIPVVKKADGKVVPVKADEPLRAECAHFLQCVCGGARPRTDAQEGLRVLSVLKHSQEALDNGAGVKLKQTRTPRAAYFAHETACIDQGCEIGAGTKIWHYSHIMKGARVGERCIFGQNCNVAGGVVIGNNVKVQNNVSIYTGTQIEDDVFLGPSCVLTNISNPRSQIVRHALYEKTVLRRGCTIGANATIVSGVTIGRYAFVAAGAVVTKDIHDYALVIGTPARQVGWMSRHGHRLRLPDDHGSMICPESGYRYREVKPNVLRCLDLDEDAPLPREHADGRRTYDSLKRSNATRDARVGSGLAYD